MSKGKLLRAEHTGEPTFVGTCHPLEIVRKSSLASNEVREHADLEEDEHMGQSGPLLQRLYASPPHMCFTSLMLQTSHLLEHI